MYGREIFKAEAIFFSDIRIINAPIVLIATPVLQRSA